MRKIFAALKCILIALLSVSWCALQTFVGAVLFLVFLPGGKVTTYRGMVVSYHRARVSFSLGVFCFISKKAVNAGAVRSHMFGHFLQSCIFGPLYLFVVTLPQLFVRIPRIEKYRAERGISPTDLFADRQAAHLQARFDA